MNIRKGFTLIELLVVIAIIGVLSTLAVVSFQGAREKGRDAVRLSDIKSVQTALELYYTDNSYYPYDGTTALADKVLGSTDYKCLGANSALSTNGFKDSACNDPVYMTKVPADPSTSGKYQYYSTIDGKKYGIKFVPETNSNNYEKGIYYCVKAGGELVKGDATAVACP